MHYRTDGSLELGTYELSLSRTFAQCIYSFTKAPISATISVIDADGLTASAITTVGEKDGWVRISATGFTFSNPEIRISLTQPSETAAQKPKTNAKGPGRLDTSTMCYRVLGGKRQVIRLKASTTCPKGFSKTK